MAVGGGGAFVGLAGQRDAVGHRVGLGVDHLQRVLGFDGGEGAAAIGLGANAMHDRPHLDGRENFLGGQVDDGDVVALAVGDIENGAGGGLRACR